MGKYQTTADVLLFVEPKEAADSQHSLKAGVSFDSDGVLLHSSGAKGTPYTFMHAQADGKSGYILVGPLPPGQTRVEPVQSRPAPVAAAAPVV